MSSSYACPRTHQPLLRQGDALVAPDGRRYPIVDGVPRFLAYPPPGEQRIEALRRALALAPRLGWRDALAEATNDPSAVAYVTTPQRAAYVELLPLGPTTRVLEVGCSLGQGTLALARRAAFVDALEVVPEQAAFARERLRQEGVSNVAVACGGDDCRLPYADERFDLVVMNLVLEWCGQREPGPFLEAQRRLLAEAARALRPEGVLFVATKNRFGLPYLMGVADEHAWQLPFGSSLPRWLLPSFLRATGRPVQPRGRLVSFRRLSTLLRDAGFGAQRAYWAAPDARYPAAYVPFDGDLAARRAALPPAALAVRRRVRWVVPHLPAALLKHVAPSLVVTAVRGPAAARPATRRAA